MITEMDFAMITWTRCCVITALQSDDVNLGQRSIGLNNLMQVVTNSFVCMCVCVHARTCTRCSYCTFLNFMSLTNS